MQLLGKKGGKQHIKLAQMHHKILAFMMHDHINEAGIATFWAKATDLAAEQNCTARTQFLR